MARGWCGWGVQVTGILYPVVLALSACTLPAGRVLDTRLDSAGFPARARYAGPIVNGRFYALGQLLAREQLRNDALQQQLTARSKEIAALQKQVERLQARETELRTSLARPRPVQAARAASSAIAVHARDGRTHGAASETAQPQPLSSAPARTGPARAAVDAQRARVLAAVRAQLVQEQQRRQAAESELARLKEETASSAYGDSASAASELAAARLEIADLRRALGTERAARARLAQELRALQERERQAAARVQDATSSSSELQARLKSLQAEKDAVVASFKQSLAASEKRTADLEQELAGARAAAAAAAATASLTPSAPEDGELRSIRSENTALRARLDDEHRRTEALAAKLKIASRVTDLIFRMRAQQVQPQATRGR